MFYLIPIGSHVRRMYVTSLTPKLKLDVVIDADITSTASCMSSAGKKHSPNAMSSNSRDELCILSLKMPHLIAK